MTRELTDATGSTVFIEMVGGAPIRSYSIRLAPESSPVGRADFLEPESDEAYLAEGGRFRVPRRADLALVSQAVRAER